VVLVAVQHHLAAVLTEQRLGIQPLLLGNLDSKEPAYSSKLIASMDLDLQPQDLPLLVLLLVLHLLQVLLLVLPVGEQPHLLGILMF
jgi:hypothetical protein